MNKANPSNKKDLYILIAASILTIFFIVTTCYTFLTPVETKTEETTQVLSQKATINTIVTPKISALYPAPEQLTGQKKYFTRVTENMKVALKADITTNPPAEFEGSSKVLLQLQAGELWQREYVLSPEKQFSGQGQMTVLNETINIPLLEILAFTKQVEEETHVYPQDGYTLNVIPIINAKSGSGNEPLVNDFTPSFSYKLTQRELTPPVEQNQEQSTNLTSVRSIPCSVNLFNLKIPVLTARYISGITTVTLIILTIHLIKRHRRDMPSLSEAQYINRRYRGHIVTAKNDIFDSDITIIKLATFKELLKLADEREKSIVSIAMDDNGAVRYCVPDGKILYCYVAAGETTEDNKELRQAPVTGDGTSA